ncbi:choline-phosphate cytidylyltransferase [Malassezia nana]|uniref:choline-phosphate cytidylyltransferase n=1 Tax=Malassezia nana TaxID=180528 RepID=A0AAF0ENJ7_9BASI|nr:choline-phosphate cytidylyltransferase [Malassezia nana]
MDLAAPVSRGRTVRVGASSGDTAPKEAGSISYSALMGLPLPQEPALAPIPSCESIRAWVQAAIFDPDPARPYHIQPPPQGRPVRIYADGVYDLFHYAHALQLRQAKLSFPSVHLIVGVVSSDLCAEHKNRPLMHSKERYEAVRNCRWVDEVLEDAPWVIDQAMIDRLQIDYVAHDELPYAMASSGAASDDVYDWLKAAGKFLPTRRTAGVSTSDLIARMVSMYRHGDLDGKLTKMGETELVSSSR